MGLVLYSVPNFIKISQLPQQLNRGEAQKAAQKENVLSTS